MQYIEHFPSYPLSQFVDKIWYCKAENISATTLTIPILHSELILNYSEEYSIKRSGEENEIIKNKSSWINGLQTNATYTESHGKHEMLGVLFKPCMIKGFFKYGSSEFTDQFIEGQLIFGKEIQDLFDKTYETNEVLSKIRLVESFIKDNMIASISPEWMKFSSEYLSFQLNSKGDIYKLSSQIGITPKSIIKGFQKNVGLTPGKFNQLQIINKTLLQLQNNPEQSISSLAYKFNFHDPSHFSSMFKRYSSLTPSEYISYMNVGNSSNQQNGTTNEYPNFINI